MCTIKLRFLGRLFPDLKEVSVVLGQDQGKYQEIMKVFHALWVLL